SQLREILGVPLTEVDLISPYFVPGESGVRDFAAMAQRGVRVRVLTNSLEATDVAVVHAGYAKRRRALLEAGVELFEMRRIGDGELEARREANGGLDDENDNGVFGPFGSSATSLHAKTFGVDGVRIFVGSFNFDPRSASLNTELGFVIDSPLLAREIADAFARDIPASSYEVRLDERGRLYWLERREDGSVRRHDSEPSTNFWLRTFVKVMSFLP